MLPIVEVPESIRRGMERYRSIFCRQEGFDHVCRYVTGLIVLPNKTLQGIHDLQVWEDHTPSRRSMHEAVFEAHWDDDQLMKDHRKAVSQDHHGLGREVIGLDWTFSHHERGPKIYATTRAWDYVNNLYSRFQTVVTASIANRQLIDGLEVKVQEPKLWKKELEALKVTAQEDYNQLEDARSRLLELLRYRLHRKQYRKRTEIAVEIAKQIEEEGHFPQASYAFDSAVLTPELARLIEGAGKHWVSELQSNRQIQWRGEWKRVDEVDKELREQHPESFREVRARCRNGEEKTHFAFTKVVRLRRYGRKRLVIVHEKEDLKDEPRFLLTDALHWESKRVIENWNFRWPIEVFHEFSKQVTGLESAQVRKEEAVKRHFRLSCVAQSLVQRAPVSGTTSERFAFVTNQQGSIGQRCRSIMREVLKGVLQLAKNLFEQGRSCDEVLEVLMPA
ncbi:MAG: hypothetical protein HY051_02900 [Candidatus Aenigmarchaeota archaeon]|nr:hypothetical protein [Candidatus Aenigmarchaeota archaeon]